MIDDTSFETHRQQILQLGRIIVEQHAKIERLNELLTRAADALEGWHQDAELSFDSLTRQQQLVTELRKAAE